MRLYDRYTTYMILSVIILMHVLSITFACYFIIKYLINTYNPSVYFLLALFIIPLIIVDYCGFFITNTFTRFLLRYSVTEAGIHFYGIGWRAWDISWDSICTYGIIGYTSKAVFPAFFVCTNADEKFKKYINQESNFLRVNKTQVCFQISNETWNTLTTHMPDDMKKKLKYSMDKHEDCFHRRHVS